MSVRLMSGPRVAELAGISYRQLDYWVTEGLIPMVDIEGGGQGTGNHRVFTDTELGIAKWMGELVRQGVKPKTASALAQAIDEQGFAYLGMFRIAPVSEVLS
jgi:DNA-binding transcriptional MerR regulator